VLLEYPKYFFALWMAKVISSTPLEPGVTPEEKLPMIEKAGKFPLMMLAKYLEANPSYPISRAPIRRFEF